MEVSAAAWPPADLKICSLFRCHPEPSLWSKKQEASLPPALSAAEEGVGTDRQIPRPANSDLHSPTATHTTKSRGPTNCRGTFESLSGTPGPKVGQGACLAPGLGAGFSQASTPPPQGPGQPAESPRPPCHSPFLGALHHQLVVTGHKLELGGPLAHALQALPHRGHGPRRPRRRILRLWAPAGPRPLAGPGSPWPPGLLSEPPVPSVGAVRGSDPGPISPGRPLGPAGWSG